MRITVEDGSKYFRGLLLLILEDGQISQPEIVLMERVGETLGFEKDFCEATIREIMGNDSALGDHPVFSTKELAALFLKDGLSLALSDGELDPTEGKWLIEVADANGLSPDSLSSESARTSRSTGLPDRLEVDDLTIDRA